MDLPPRSSTRAPPPPPIQTHPWRPPYQQSTRLPPQPPAPEPVDVENPPFSLDNFKIILGYDFGTTYSGCSYAYSQNEEIFDITKWYLPLLSFAILLVPPFFLGTPSPFTPHSLHLFPRRPRQNNNFYPKTPTLSIYKRRNPTRLVDWGNKARLSMLGPLAKEHIMLTKFKLGLDESLNRPPLENGISVVDAIADYLRQFHNHVISELTKGFARNYGAHQIRYCLTVPAMWSDKAKNSMRQAAVKAGLISADDHPDRLMLISEPEAAALYCEKHCEQVNLTHGDRFMICDAGGGTVDLIVFEIEGEGKSRRLKEITKGAGQSCGSTFLDDNFRAMLEETFGGQLERLQGHALDLMVDQFVDQIKVRGWRSGSKGHIVCQPEFDGLEDHFLTLPAAVDLDSLSDRNIGLEEGVLTLRATDLKAKVFEPVILQVLNLIESQLEQVPSHRLSAIFLVGGFGSSNYLYQRVNSAFGVRVPQILAPSRAGLAVVRGAVYFGLNPHAVISRVSRRTYGINAGLPFDPNRDPVESRAQRPDGSIRCTTRFLEFTRKGNSIPIDHCVKEEMYIYYGTLKTTDVLLYATEREDVPRYYNESGVHQVAAIEIPIPEMKGVKVGQRVGYSVRYVVWNELCLE
ncbi:hypothetical protein BC936DRAFT_141178 [Jimgerdemannia flammicorona]|uniref:Actin-like ATPase domain-containing protein n=1 Tax=Jimgerdemannia flammicorona TaxID=994334 RepID=A0A433A2Q9_9FUNG|nr:hypothetical protein BC936DRAFT_141178 [Jimgerdemannia flammicorona]